MCPSSRSASVGGVEASCQTCSVHSGEPSLRSRAPSAEPQDSAPADVRGWTARTSCSEDSRTADICRRLCQLLGKWISSSGPLAKNIESNKMMLSLHNKMTLAMMFTFNVHDTSHLTSSAATTTEDETFLGLQHPESQLLASHHAWSWCSCSDLAGWNSSCMLRQTKPSNKPSPGFGLSSTIALGRN